MADNISRQLKIFVAWPADVEDERNRAEEVIQNLQKAFLSRGCHLEMLDWRNSVPPGAGNPEDVILETTDPSSWDVFIGILWKRFGTLLKDVNPRTGKPYASGFEAEYERAHILWEKNERPHIMLYRCTRPVPHDADVEQLKLVQHFFQGIEKRYEVLYKRYDSPNDFADKLSTDLTMVVEKIIKSIPKKRPLSFPHSSTYEDITEQTDFSNREHELAQIQNLLLTDPDASIMVCAPAGMGKSRLKEHLQEIFSSPNAHASPPFFHCIRLDCDSDEGISASTDKLLLAIYQRLLSANVISANPGDLRRALRIEIMNLMAQSKRLIILLDRVELMSPECSYFLRHEFLPDLRNVVRERTYYPAVIAFGRIHPRAWRGEEVVRFGTVVLSPFRKDVVEEILRRKTGELNLHFSDSIYNEWAEGLLNVSHGHPRCIVNLASWLYEERFSVPTVFNSKEIFLSFVTRVIEREILSEDSLAPFETIDRRSVVAELLRQALPYVCIFRFCSIAQLRILAHCKLINKNDVEELEGLLHRTFLMEHPVRQVWFKPHRIIRRLLADLLNYQQRKIFSRINQAACQFYDAWITGTGGKQLHNFLGGSLQDYDQIYYIVEGLYHHSLARKRHESTMHLREILNIYLHSLRGTYPVKYLTRMLANYMLDDFELMQVVQRQGKPNDYSELVSLVENWNE